MKKSTIIWLALAFIGMAFLMGQIYKAGLTRPPLKYAHIPDGTKEFIEKLKSGHGGGITIGGFGPFNWDNDSDLGLSDDWSREEDEDFVVYYHKDDNAVWQGRAQDVLTLARNAIPAMTALMGKYFYASDMNGRKLAFYLPTSDAEFFKVGSELQGKPWHNTQPIGVTFMHIGPLGCLTDGILLRPSIFTADKMNGYEFVTLHEMHHYVFFTALDYNQTIRHFNWMSEGMAEFFCKRYDEMRSGFWNISTIEDKCYLSGDFPDGAEYWAGESFFKFLQGTFGDQFLRNFIQSSYVNSTEKLLTDKLLVDNLNRAAQTTGNMSPEARAIMQALQTIRDVDQKGDMRDLSAFMHEAWVMTLKGDPFEIVGAEE